MITAMMSESGEQRRPGRPGRPAMSSDEKKKQKSIYLSPDAIQFLSKINPNLSAAIEKLVEEKKHQ